MQGRRRRRRRRGGGEKIQALPMPGPMELGKERIGDLIGEDVLKILSNV